MSNKMTTMERVNNVVTICGNLKDYIINFGEVVIAYRNDDGTLKITTADSEDKDFDPGKVGIQDENPTLDSTFRYFDEVDNKWEEFKIGSLVYTGEFGSLAEVGNVDIYHKIQEFRKANSNNTAI